MTTADALGPFADVELTPTSFLDRAAATYAARIAVVGPDRSYTYVELNDRCWRLAGGLADDLGAAPGDRVSALVPNTHVALELHFGVPRAGAVLNMLNVRLSAEELTYIVKHVGAGVLVVDPEYLELAGAIRAAVPGLTLIATGPGGEYEALLERAERPAPVTTPERSLLAVNYTSGTTGRPKGVMYSHRGAYLQALAMAAQAHLGTHPVFLWTLPMFHCNGWCFPWAVTAVGGTHIELVKVDAEAIWTLIGAHGVTHLNAAPTVLTMLAASPAATRLSEPLRVATGGSPPSPSLLAALEEFNVEVTHLYGLTETYGPAVICELQRGWQDLPRAERARLIARQGVSNLVGVPLRVIDQQGNDTPSDGESVGEVVLRGSNVMLGYYRDPDATAAVNAGGWFRTGDLGVIHPDGYLELRDRAKDIIISGGENIASIEVEQVLAAHPAVLECAVVGAPDDRWGEVPVAFVSLRPSATVSVDELQEWVRRSLARFKVPKQIHFGELPKTATGKIQKYRLREEILEAST